MFLELESCCQLRRGRPVWQGASRSGNIRVYPPLSVFIRVPKVYPGEAGKEKGRPKPPLASEATGAYSRSPPKMPSSASRFAKMLYRLRYTASVAEM